jgi:peptide chain release factor 3
MEVLHPRTGKRIRMNRAHRLFAQDRETIEIAYPGDIIGLVNPGDFHLGDTICEGPPLNLEPLPQFSPEFFAIVRCKDTSRRKQFDRGMTQLVEEGAIQVFTSPGTKRKEPIFAAVGELQFDVVRYRLESEYNAESSLEWLPFKIARWVKGEAQDRELLEVSYSALRVVDSSGRDAVLFRSRWDAEYCAKENPRLRFSEFAGELGTFSPQDLAAVQSW